MGEKSYIDEKLKDEIKKVSREMIQYAKEHPYTGNPSDLWNNTWLLSNGLSLMYIEDKTIIGTVKHLTLYCYPRRPTEEEIEFCKRIFFKGLLRKVVKEEKEYSNIIHLHVTMS